MVGLPQDTYVYKRTGPRSIQSAVKMSQMSTVLSSVCGGQDQSESIEFMSCQMLYQEERKVPPFEETTGGVDGDETK